MKLTDIACRTAKPTEKNYKLRDGQGLYLLVMKAGGKSWRYDYKIRKHRAPVPERLLLLPTSFYRHLWVSGKSGNYAVPSSGRN